MNLSDACHSQQQLCKDVRDIEHLNGQIAAAQHEARRVHARAQKLHAEMQLWLMTATPVEMDAYISHCSRMGWPAVSVVPSVEGS